MLLAASRAEHLYVSSLGPGALPLHLSLLCGAVTRWMDGKREEGMDVWMGE